MKNKRILHFVFVSILMLTICAIAPTTSSAADKTVLQVLAGAGLKDALNELKTIYGRKSPAVEIRFSLAASGILEHINLTGDYMWKQNKLVERNKLRSLRPLQNPIAVEIPLTGHPPHRSRRACFTHRAPTSGV